MLEYASNIHNVVACKEHLRVESKNTSDSKKHTQMKISRHKDTKTDGLKLNNFVLLASRSPPTRRQYIRCKTQARHASSV